MPGRQCSRKLVGRRRERAPSGSSGAGGRHGGGRPYLATIRVHACTRVGRENGVSTLWVVRELGDPALAVGDFVLFVPPHADIDRLRVLRYYGAYNDLAINEQMLDDFEHDIRNAEECYAVIQNARNVTGGKAALVLPYIELARSEHCYVVLVGD